MLVATTMCILMLGVGAVFTIVSATVYLKASFMLAVINGWVV